MLYEAVEGLKIIPHKTSTTQRITQQHINTTTRHTLLLSTLTYLAVVLMCVICAWWTR